MPFGWEIRIPLIMSMTVPATVKASGNCSHTIKPVRIAHNIAEYRNGDLIDKYYDYYIDGSTEEVCDYKNIVLYYLFCELMA